MKRIFKSQQEELVLVFVQSYNVTFCQGKNQSSSLCSDADQWEFCLIHE